MNIRENLSRIVKIRKIRDLIALDCSNAFYLNLLAYYSRAIRFSLILQNPDFGMLD